MENIGGIFVVLICGLIIAVFVAVMEFIWSTRRSAESEEVRRLVKGVCGRSGTLGVEGCEDWGIGTGERIHGHEGGQRGKEGRAEMRVQGKGVRRGPERRMWGEAEVTKQEEIREPEAGECS